MEKVYIIDLKHEGMSIIQYVREVLLFSRRYTKFIKQNGGEAFVNDEAALFHHALKEGDVLIIKIPDEIPSNQLIAERMKLDIVYEDDDILVINKPAGIASIPSNREQTGTLTNGIFGYFQEHNLPFTVHIVTRLDRDTSGLILIAKHRACHAILSTMQQKNMIKRRYIAIVKGTIQVKKGTLNKSIGRAQDSIIKRTISIDGQSAITHYEVVEENIHLSIVRVTLETGRTHQIRVHFSALGNPLIGDTLYGTSSTSIDRQALHCELLELIHPFTNKKMEFIQNKPCDMMNLIRKCSEF